MDEVLVRAFVTTRQLGTSNERFFAVVTDVISDTAVVHGFSFSQAVCLGLSNLCHPLLEIRRRAFAILEGIHQHVSKNIIYSCLAFSLAVELLNIKLKQKQDKYLKLNPDLKKNLELDVDHEDESK